jgi:fatty-acyl-CoA synthase
MRFADASTPIARHPTVSSRWTEPGHAYGSTETFTITTCYPASTPPEVHGGSSGEALPGVTLKITDPLTGAVVPRGERGEICVKGPTLMLGYLGTPLDETLDHEGYFRTGDGGYLDARGRLFWEGRLTDIIKTGGANVSPREVDEALAGYPGVKVAQTVGVPHETLGEIVVACVVPHEGASLEAEGIRSFLRERLASYKVPRRVLFFRPDEITLTGSAKIKAADLRDLAAKALATSP